MCQTTVTESVDFSGNHVFFNVNSYAEIYYTVAKPVDSKMVTPSHYNIAANPTKLVILSELH
jgi:hypothetical protein